MRCPERHRSRLKSLWPRATRSSACALKASGRAASAAGRVVEVEMVRQQHVKVEDVEFDLYESTPSSSVFTVCAAHPADTLDSAACDLLAATTGFHAVCVNPRASD